MKKWISVLVAVGAIVLMACKEKKQSDDILVGRQEVEAPKPKGPIAMQDYSDSKTIEWLGSSYTIIISRNVSDDLPMVTDEDGQQYKDNFISLRITRQDGSVFFSQDYTKEMFQSYLSDSYVKGGVLEAMIFDGVQGAELRFAVSVCKPDSDDEFIPLVLTVNSQRGISIRRDTAIDTTGMPTDEEV